jgi:tRNA pseudouridine32 synthase / 23S rRNA pseudouridine746 synthase
MPLTPAVEVVFQDDWLLVLNKPAGLLSVPGKGDDKQDCLSTRVRSTLPSACIVHRLDMATSGLMLMALDPGVQRALNRQFELRTVHKRYVAVVDGNLCDNDNAPGAWHLIDLPIAVDWPHRPLRVIDPVNGKPSQTRWQALGYDAGTHTTRVALEPMTGRSHQLRVHLLAIGHPMVGDALYAPLLVQAKAERLLLHAQALSFDHPQTAQRLTFSSQPPF